MAIDIRECKIGSRRSQWEHSAGGSNHGSVFSFRVATVADRFAIVASQIFSTAERSSTMLPAFARVDSVLSNNLVHVDVMTFGWNFLKHLAFKRQSDERSVESRMLE